MLNGFVVELVTPVPTVRKAPASTFTSPLTVSLNLRAVLSLIRYVPLFTYKLPLRVRLIVCVTVKPGALILRLL